MAKEKRVLNWFEMITPCYRAGERYWPLQVRAQVTGRVARLEVCCGVDGVGKELWKKTQLHWSSHPEQWLYPENVTDLIKFYASNNLQGWQPTDTIYLSFRF